MMAHQKENAVKQAMFGHIQCSLFVACAWPWIFETSWTASLILSCEAHFLFRIEIILRGFQIHWISVCDLDNIF